MSKREVIGFYKPEEENGYLSNWYRATFMLDGILYFCMEQYMMYKKAELFEDEEAVEKILESMDQAEIKDLGRGVKNYDDEEWSGRRQLIVYKGLLAKFEQNPNLKEELLSTGDAILAECAKGDKIWGIGLAVTNERYLDPEKWNGQNLLGYTLMEVREALEHEQRED